VLPDRRYDSI